MRRISIFAVLAVSLLSGAVRGQAQVRFTEGSARYQASVARPALSADGKSLYVWTRTYDSEQEAPQVRVLHLDFDGNELTSNIQRTAPYFSRDGRYHAFKSTGDDGSYGIHIYDVAEAESRFIAPVHESNAFLGHRAIKNLVWSPDGERIAYVSAEEGAADEEAGPIVANRLLFKSRTALSDNLRSHIFVVDVNGSEPSQLTSGPYDEHSIDWSPDGEQIVFISNRAADPDDVHANDVWTVELSSGAVTRITDTPGPEFAPRYSPDGRWIAYLGGVRPINTRDSPMENDQLWVVEAAGGEPLELSGSLDRRVKEFQWSGDGRHLYFRADNLGGVHLFRVAVDGGEVVPIVTGEVEVTSFVVSPTLDRVAYRMVSQRRPAEIYVTTLDGAWHRRITHLQDGFVQNVSFSLPETVWFESFDGTRVQGWLAKPNPYEPGRRYPLILTVHGGPHGAYRYSIDWLVQRLAEGGYGVLQVNPRGSVGYGQEFADGTLNDWGGKDYRDLMTGVDYAIEKNDWIDPDRLGVFGYSYGGYMTNWIVTQTDRFKAAVAGGSVSNLISFYGTSLYHLLVETEFPGEVWQNYELLWDRSPLKHVANVKTPVLFVHGEVDHDVPVTQAEEMFVALRKLGVESELVRYPGLGHQLGGPQVFDAFGRIMGWFDRFLYSPPTENDD